jgi:Divergent InlB B-repeat domain
MRYALRLAAPVAALIALAAVVGGADTQRAAATTRQLPRLLGVLHAPRTATARQASGTLLDYHGGQVLHTNTTYPVFWSPPGYAMPADYQAAITKYFQDVAAGSGSAASSYAVTTQYFDDGGAISTQSRFGGALVSTEPIAQNECTDQPAGQVDVPIGVCVLSNTLAQVVDDAASAAGIAPGGDAIFFLVMPPGVGTCGDRNDRVCAYAQFAAYHSYTSARNLFTVHPYFAKTPLSGISHEHIEVMTDPFGGGWYTDDEQQLEIADICQNAPAVDQVLGSGTYALQQEWSNATGGCSTKAPPPTTPLTLAVLGKSGGAVTAALGGASLTCPDPEGKPRCRTVVRRGARVSVTAQPGANVIFSSWDKASPCADKHNAHCTFTTSETEAIVTALFGKGTSGGLFLVSIDVHGRGAVVWPNGTKCRTSCIKAFPGGSLVVLRAVPVKGWHLTRFADDAKACKGGVRCKIRLQDNDNVFATFARNAKR